MTLNRMLITKTDLRSGNIFDFYQTVLAQKNCCIQYSTEQFR